MGDAVPALVCRRLRLRQFRNFRELELEFPPVGVAVIGDNGSGKTNLLESLYYLEIFRSFRGAPDEQLVRFGGQAFHVLADFADPIAGPVQITAAYEPGTRTKRVTVDGVAPERVGDAIGRVRVVVFSPSDMAIVAGGPSERRRYLDIVLSVNVTGYLGALQRYRHVMRQRNALLRDGASAALVEAWDVPFLEAGARIVHERARWVAAHAEGFSRRYMRVGQGPPARLSYRPGLRLTQAEALDASAAALAFSRESARSATRERERGITLLGPHRDDLALDIEADGGTVELREFGSGGQLRTAAIALRMLEAESARQARGTAPIVLLDDVFAELDPGRSGRLLEMLETEGHGQVILTAPKASDVQLRNAAGAASITSLPRWSISAGRITD